MLESLLSFLQVSLGDHHFSVSWPSYGSWWPWMAHWLCAVDAIAVSGLQVHQSVFILCWQTMSLSFSCPCSFSHSYCIIVIIIVIMLGFYSYNPSCCNWNAFIPHFNYYSYLYIIMFLDVFFSSCVCHGFAY